jgi:hypothetical protein
MIESREPMRVIPQFPGFLSLADQIPEDVTCQQTGTSQLSAIIVMAQSTSEKSK